MLPFKNFAGSTDEHIGIGMADVLITRLGSIKELTVRPTGAVLKFNNNEQDSIAAGLALGVEGVLEGSIHRVGDRIRVTARAEEHELVLSVEDAGPGLSPDLVERGVSGAGGTGLGLDIARRTAELHGGVFRIGRSAAGGARIALELPTTGPPPEPSPR